MARINKTNNMTRAGDQTITDLIAKRDCLKTRVKIMRDFLNASSDMVNRYSKTEIKICSTVSVAELQKKGKWSEITISDLNIMPYSTASVYLIHQR